MRGPGNVEPYRQTGSWLAGTEAPPHGDACVQWEVARGVVPLLPNHPRDELKVEPSFHRSFRPRGRRAGGQNSPFARDVAIV
jgi:hypothetical protein